MTNHFRRYALSFVAGLLAPTLTRAAEAVPLVLADDGKTSARILLAAEAPKDVQDAAAELARVLEKMSGARLPVDTLAAGASVDKAVTAIVLGAPAEALGVKMEKKSRAGDGFRYKVQGSQLLLVGESPSGVYTGAMRFLESLGCGWYVPGPLGEVIPAVKRVAVPATLDVTGVSNSINRRFWYGGKNGNGVATDAWLRRLNGANYQSGSWSHAYGHLLSEEMKKQHPEYGSLNRGKRTFKQLCTTNPEVVKAASETLMADMAKKKEQLVFAAGPNDGGNLCQCPECAKLDTPGYLEPSSGLSACSDRIFTFASEVANLTAKQFPDRDLGILVYSEYSRIPQKIQKLSPNVFPMIAPIRRCRIHGPDNPVCEMNKLLGDEIRGWAKLGTKLGFYPYNYNLADTLMPFSKLDFYRRLARIVNEADIQQLAWIFETIDSWAQHAPSLYLSARLSWDTHFDIDAEMERFYQGFYGAAAAPMKSYWTRLDRVYETTASHTGSSYGMHMFWTKAVLTESRLDIDKAKTLAANEREKEAVAMAEAGLHCAELYMRVWKCLRACEFAGAAAAQAELGAHVKAMTAKTEPNWVHERYAFTQYYKRFVGLTVDGGAAIVANGGQVVAGLPDVWKFATDEKGVGREQGWFKPEYDSNKWKDMHTMESSWVDQGLTWYQGDAWYRTEFTLPADAKGQDLRLWFGGFDNNVDVYLNGEALGEKTGFVKPVEYADVARCLRFGERNVLAVRVSAGDLAEIGTGGIMMPVMIYRAGTAPAVPVKPPAGTPDKAAPAKPAYEM